MTEIEYLPVEYVSRFQTHARHKYTTKEWSDFKKDIREKGILEPLVLSVNPISKTMELTQGAHRLYAATELNLKEVPVICTIVTLKNFKFVNENIKGYNETMIRKATDIIKEIK